MHCKAADSVTDFDVEHLCFLQLSYCSRGYTKEELLAVVKRFQKLSENMFKYLM